MLEIKCYNYTLVYHAPHGALKYIRINFVQLNRLVRAHFGLLEVAAEHFFKYRATRRESQLVAFKILQINIKAILCQSLIFKFASAP